MKLSDREWQSMMIEAFSAPGMRWYWRFLLWGVALLERKGGDSGMTQAVMCLLVVSCPPSRFKEAHNGIE